MRVLRSVILTSLCLGSLAGCTREPPNVLLIVVDTLRADHLSSYGSPRTTSPAIDELAAQGVRFTRAYATGPWTKPSVASMFTGLYPSAHGVTRLARRLPRRLPTLAEILSTHGYATAGVVSHTLIGSEYGFERGFETYLESEAQGAEHVSTEGVTRQAIRLLEEIGSGDRPFFLFVHYFDPHYTYKRHPEYGFAARGAGRLRGGEPIRILRRIAATLTPDELQLVRDVYDEEIRFTDEGIGQLLGTLRELGLESRTWTVLTADHGEEFLDRGHLGHTRTLHEELVRAPLIIRGPGSRRSSTVDRPVSLVSLPATILEMSGIQTQYAFHGPSLLPLVVNRSAPSFPPPLFEVDFVPRLKGNADKEAHKRGLATAEFKLIEDMKTGKLSLYDLGSDPGETVDLAEKRPELLRSLSTALSETATRMEQPGPAAREVPLSEEQIERLRELGYVGD
jgi:arylsulfatase A-like enzyme